jgi:hypothetical protein
MSVRSIKGCVAICRRHRRFKLLVYGVQFVLAEHLPKNEESQGVKMLDLLF